METSKISNCEFLTHHQISEFVKKSFTEIKDKKDINDLIHFHSINKFLLMAHHPNYVKILGNIIANHEKISESLVFDKYEEQLNLALRINPSQKSHVNVLQKILGYFKKDLSSEEKSKILVILTDYRTGKVTLNDVLLLLEDLTRKFQKTYLIRQTYFLLYAKVTK